MPPSPARKATPRLSNSLGRCRDRRSHPPPQTVNREEFPQPAACRCRKIGKRWKSWSFAPPRSRGLPQRRQIRPNAPRVTTSAGIASGWASWAKPLCHSSEPGSIAIERAGDHAAARFPMRQVLRPASCVWRIDDSGRTSNSPHTGRDCPARARRQKARPYADRRPRSTS